MVIWLIWLVALLVCIPVAQAEKADVDKIPSLPGLVIHDVQKEGLFLRRVGWRWKKWSWRRYHAWRRAYRRAKRIALVARLVLRGALKMAQVVDWLTASQLRYKLGALLVLYALLETLKIRQIINRHCPTLADVDHGTVALVLILNRLMFPLPLYRVADWVERTVLVTVLGVPAAKFNDDRLGRTLDALYSKLEAIWLEVVDTAMAKADIDLSVIFYDLTAFVAHGCYADSKMIDFGFAHNTPSNKRKFKLGLNVAADGNIPWLYRLWSGRTADQATVQRNMDRLAQWLNRRGYTLRDTLVVGDRAMLNDEIAVSYDQHDLRYLAGLQCRRTEHKALLTRWTEERFSTFPLETGKRPQYWGRGCQVVFTHNERTVIHKGLVVLAGPIRDQLRQTRNARLQTLSAELTQLRESIGQPRLRSVKAVQRRVKARLRASKVGHLMDVTVTEMQTGHVALWWRVDEGALWQAEQQDGRYLLVTNNWSLSHQEMFQLYRQKDGVEKRFHVDKSDLKVSPIYLHHDRRIASMLLLNMLALLAYSILERQVRQHGLSLTTRQIIRRLENLTVIETRCWDGSRLRRLAPIDPECLFIIQLVMVALDDLVQAVTAVEEPLFLPTPSPLALPLTC
jgi:transposase